MSIDIEHRKRVTTFRNYAGFAEDSDADLDRAGVQASLVHLGDSLGWAPRRHRHIGGAWNEPGKPSPMTTVGWWNPKGRNFVLDWLVEALLAEGGPDLAGELVVDFTFPLVLREPGLTPKTPQRAERVRQALAEVADGTRRWSRGDFLADCVEPYADAVAAAVQWVKDAYGVTIRAVASLGWEFTFTVFPWSASGLELDRPNVDHPDGIVTSTGLRLAEHHGARWHTAPPIDEWVAAYTTVGAVFADRGTGLVLSSDKNMFDVAADGPHQGRVISDVIFDRLGDFVASTGGGTGGGVGADLYVNEQHITFDAFEARYGAMGRYVGAHAERVGVGSYWGEVGVGSGREDVAGEDTVDTRGPVDYLAWLFDQPEVRAESVAWFTPNKGGHDLRRDRHPGRRWAALQNYSADPASGWAQPLYTFESVTGSSPPTTTLPNLGGTTPAPEPEPEPEPEPGPLFDPLDVMDAAIVNMADRINEADAATDWTAGMSALLNGLDELQVALAALTAHLREQRTP